MADVKMRIANIIGIRKSMMKEEETMNRKEDECMERLAVYETDRGRYAVRPMDWAGIWNKEGQIKESLNHIALFLHKEDAERFAEWKDLEERGLLLNLPCKVGDTVYVNGALGARDSEEWKVTRVDYHSTLGTQRNGFHIEASLSNLPKHFTGFYDNDFGKRVFFTQAEAEEALKNG